MINRKEFDSIKQDLNNWEEQREQTIQLSREIIKHSKEIIYALHRDDVKKAESVIKEIKLKVAKLSKDSYDTGMSEAAKQEYVEALVYYHILKEKKIPTRKELNVDTHPYLSGLCDLTGELVRKAYRDVIENKKEDAKAMITIVDNLYYEFLQFDPRGDLRKKADSIKYNLAKLEDLMYALAMKER